jgi:hypothetical protein
MSSSQGRFLQGSRWGTRIAQVLFADDLTISPEFGATFASSQVDGVAEETFSPYA